MTLERGANTLLGGMILAMGGYMLWLHLTSGEPLQVLILLLSGALICGAAVCLQAGLTAKSDTRTGPPPLPAAGEVAARRLLVLKQRPVRGQVVRSAIIGDYAGYRP